MKMFKKLAKMAFIAAVTLSSTTVLTSCQRGIEAAIDGVLKPLNDEVDKWNAEKKARHLENLQNWTHSETDEEAIKKFGYEKCFSVVTLPDKYWEDYNMVDLSPNVDKQNLREVRSLFYSVRDNSKPEIRIGSIICDKRIANDLLDIFRSLYEQKYPIEDLTPCYTLLWQQLMDLNSSFCYYYNAHQPESADLLQQQGLVVVLNPAFAPADGQDKAVQLFRQHGFTWGGDKPNGQRYRFERQF